MNSIRVLSITEWNTITGPAKNLLQFSASARTHLEEPQTPLFIAGFHRKTHSTLFLEAVRTASVPLTVIEESGRFDRSVFTKLRQTVDAVSPQIIQSHGVKSHFLIRFLGLHKRARWIAFQHGYTWPDWQMRVYNQLDRWSLRTAARVITMNESFKRDLISRGIARKRIEVLHNAVDPAWAGASSTEAATSLRAQWQIPSRARVVLTVGRLSSEKDPLMLLRAMAILGRSLAHDSWKLILVGEGPEHATLESEAIRLGLRENIVFTGHVSETRAFYGIADAFVLPSRTEGSPNALLEAMAVGVPIVATRVGGVPEMLTHDREGYLVEPGDPAALAEGIRVALQQPARARAWADHAQQRARSAFSPETRLRRLRQIYFDVLQE